MMPVSWQGIRCLMKICVVGAGAIGGQIAGHMARAGHEVSVVARGPHLEAIRARGLTIRHDAEAFTIGCATAGDPAAFEPQDAVFLALKAHDIAAMLPRLAPLLGAQTTVVPAINGLPWWYFHREGGRFDGRSIECVDPGGAMLAALDPARIVGCVVFAAGEVAEPGVIHQTMAGSPLTLGELDGRTSARLTDLAAALNGAGIKTTTTDAIRAAVWSKLLGNMSFNPVGALACARVDEIFAQPRLLDLVSALMTEAVAVSAAFGISYPFTVPQRVAAARKLGRFKSSMLQDVERGRPLEVEEIVGAVVELGAWAGVPTPTTAMVHALTKGRNLAITGAASA